MHTRSLVLFAGLVLAMPAAVWAARPGGCKQHCGGCSPAPCQTCEPVPDVLKHTKAVYTCKGADICLVKRSLGELLRLPRKPGCCESCGECGCDCECPHCSCPQCECRPRHKTVLLKRIVTTECPSFKCEPVCCPEPCGCASPWFESAPLPGEDHIVPDEAMPPKPIPVPPSAAAPRRPGKKVR